MISIIVPVLNEEKNIEKLLSRLNTLQGEKEIIIVDGGSTDNTINIAEKYGMVIESSKGRAIQMNTGASLAKGDILWFVHSDSVVSDDSLTKIKRTIEEGHIGGGFSLYFYDLKTMFMRYVAWTSNLRAKYLGLIFGDQGLFVRKDVFQHLGGYKKMELMEDWELSRSIHRLGKTKIIDSKIGTSARRFKIGGQLRTFFFMQKIKLLYVLGTPPSRLSQIYREVR